MADNAPNIVSRRCIDRRAVLRGIGVAMGLPLLDAMTPASAAQPAGPPTAAPHRMVAINLHLGFMAHNFTPEQAGENYTPSKYLQIIDAHRRDYTVVTGVSHPGVAGAHESDKCFLTAAPGVGHPGFKNSISLDQIVAERHRGQTRFDHLPLSYRAGRLSLSWSASGANIPPISHPVDLYERMFLEGTPRQKAQRKQNLRDGRSVMDAVMNAASDLSKDLGPTDRDKLDQYFTSVRQTERRFHSSQQWVDRPKPKVDAEPPQMPKDAAEFVDETELMYDMIHLALLSDSTRVITYAQPNLHVVLPDREVRVGYHALSHHNNDPEKMKQLEIIELKQMQAFESLLDKLAKINEPHGRLLDSTVVLLGSNFGNASNHDTRNMPIVVAGGGFRHGRHLAFDKNHNTPLSNLYVSMLQRLGVERDAFGTSTGTLNGLEPAGA